MDEGHYWSDQLQGVVFVCLQLCCNSPIELITILLFCYCRDQRLCWLCHDAAQLCCYCTEVGVRDGNSLKSFRVVLPLCDNCRNSGKKIIKRLQKY
ncbi:uncharacterized protein LOC132757930 [Ruditapes philippinarum]|uniref:uncharacterized protein LOC132757930 n=1 Tax=Ruditapes philippinarum TaxID=129788 RepID=UPI00295A7A79|nr:uncharacterized protein LOC132757930 [Ruditapes philippinarum]